MGLSTEGLPPGYNFIEPVVGGGVAEDNLSGSVSLVGGELLWNVAVGCSGGSPACQDCAAKPYWERWSRSTGYYNDADSWGYVIAYEYALTADPAKWPKDQPQRILVAPAGDLFNERVSDAFLDRVLGVMQRHPQHSFYILTKRAERMRAYFASRAKGMRSDEARRDPQLRDLKWPLPNVLVGISCEDQRTYVQRVRELVQTPAARRFVVAEPMLGPIRMEQVQLETRDVLWPFKGIVQAYLGQLADGKYHWDSLDHPLQTVGTIDWVVVGGYRGKALKPMHPIWVRMIQTACAREQVPFHFKGWGDYVPVRTPDLDTDETLVILSQNGSMRGRGAGSSTNHLALKIDGTIPDLYMSRKAPVDQQQLLAGRKFQQMPAAVPPQKVRLTDRSDVARMLHRLSDPTHEVSGPTTHNRGTMQNSPAPANNTLPPGALDTANRTMADKMLETATWFRDKLNTPLW